MKPTRPQVSKRARRLARTLAIASVYASFAHAHAHAQELDLRGLLNPAARAPDLAVGYEADPNWPRAVELRHDDAPVSAVAVDRDQHVWVLSRGSVAVRVFDTKGNLLRSWSDVSFRKPHGLGFDADGNVWITDAGAHIAQKFTPAGQLLQTLGTPNEPGDDSSHFDQPTDVAVGPDGAIYVSDGYGNNRVVRFDPTGKYLGAFGREGSALGEFRLPHALAFDSKGQLYVADRSNARIQVFDSSGHPLREFRNLMVPWDLSITPDDALFVCGSSPMRWPKGPRIGVPLGIPPKDQLVMKLNTEGTLQELWTFPQGSRYPGELDWVHGIATDAQADLYLCDIEGKRVQKFHRQNDARLKAREHARP
jgi:hypothetical protein